MFEPPERRDDVAPAPRHLSSFHLEVLRLGAAPDAEHERMERHLSQCERCRRAAAAWAASRQEFAEGALERTRGALRLRTTQAMIGPLRRKTFAGLAALALASAAAAGFVAVWHTLPADGGHHHADVEPGLGIKGGLDFVVAARRGGRIFHADTEPLRAGDQLRFVLEGIHSSYLMVASVDGAGHASIYVPYEGTQSLPVAASSPEPGPGEHFEVTGSIVLDAAPGPERVFALISRRPLPAGPVRDALSMIGGAGPSTIRDTTVMTLPSDVVAVAGPVVQRTVLIEKVRE